jgi:hypothetical protein
MFIVTYLDDQRWCYTGPFADEREADAAVELLRRDGLPTAQSVEVEPWSEIRHVACGHAAEAWRATG